MIYALASSDIVKELKSFAGKEKSTIDMIYDAQKAKGQTVALVSSFATAFEVAIENSLYELARPENLNRRAVERGHLCLQLLGLSENHNPRFMAKVIIPYCEGASLPGILGAPPAPVVTRAMWSQTTENRICLHQNWRRHLLIFERGLN